MGISIWQLIIVALLIGLVLLPPICALFSTKAKGWSKFIWFLLSGSFSWLGYLAYYFIAIKSNNGDKS